jgi:DnaK suppressor protein
VKAPVKKKSIAVKKPVVKAKPAPAKKAAAKPMAKPSKSAAKPASKPVPKAKPAAKAKPVVKAAAKPVAKKAAAKPIAKVAAKSSAKPAAKPAIKAASKTIAKPITKAAQPSSASKVLPKSPVKPAAKPAVKTASAGKAPSKAPIKAPVTSAKPATKAPAKPVAKAPAKAAAPVAPAKAPAKTVAKPAVKPAVKAAASPKAPVAVVAKPAPAPVVAAPVAPAAVAAKPKNSKGFNSPSNIAPKAMQVSTAAKTNFTMSSPVLAPVIQLVVKKDAKLVNNWKTKTAAELTDAEAIAMPDSEYMNALQMAFFRLKLVQLKKDLLNSAGETTEHLREDTSVVPDPADRATIEEEHALELRTRDRERKLLKKIEQSITRIDADDYGYCDETGEAIGVSRLIARPTASLSLEAQQRRELKQKMFGD